MIRHLALAMSLALSGLVSEQIEAQPRLVAPTVDSYRIGDRVDPDVRILDRNGDRLRLLDVIAPGSRVVVVIFFGGGYASVRNPARFRGPLWCRDSYDDLSIQRAMVQQFSRQPVQFIPVAVPPVYHAARYGYPEDGFLGLSEDDDEYGKTVRQFIERTEAQRASTVLPFREVYYDPRFRLTQNKKERALGPEYGPVEPWQGRFRWHLDPRIYGTPAIWLLDAEGTVLQAPFVGNVYDTRPPEIAYGFEDLKAAIEKYLQ